MALKALEQAITALSLSISSILALAFSDTFAATFTLVAARVLTIAVGLAALAWFLGSHREARAETLRVFKYAQRC